MEDILDTTAAILWDWYETSIGALIESLSSESELTSEVSGNGATWEHDLWIIGVMLSSHSSFGHDDDEISKTNGIAVMGID